MDLKRKQTLSTALFLLDDEEEEQRKKEQSEAYGWNSGSKEGLN